MLASGTRSRTSGGRGLRLAVLLAVALAIVAVPVQAFAAYRQTYAFVNKWAIPTPYPSSGFQPHGMAIGSDGTVWIASHDNYVASYTATGGLIATYGSNEQVVFGLSPFSQVDNVAVSGTDLWLMDTDHGIARMTTSGSDPNLSFSAIPGGGAVNLPAGVAEDASGSVYLGDDGSSSGYGFRVSKFTSAGSFVGTFGDTNATGPLQSASGIAVAPDFTVYVADWQAGKVRVYRPDASRSTYTLVASWESDLFDSPYSVAVDPAGNVFVLDSSSMTVTKLSSAGAVLAHWGGLGSTPGAFAHAWSLAVAPNGHIFVDDRDDFSVQEFQSIDHGPSTQAAGNVTVKKGKKATFKFRADDDWSASCALTLQIYKGSKLKATISCGSMSQGAWHTKAWTCKLAKATYTWKVYANDTTGHSQINIASKTLKVK